MQHSRNKHTTNHDKNSLNFFTTPLEFTTNPKKTQCAHVREACVLFY